MRCSILLIFLGFLAVAVAQNAFTRDLRHTVENNNRRGAGRFTKDLPIRTSESVDANIRVIRPRPAVLPAQLTRDLPKGWEIKASESVNVEGTDRLGVAGRLTRDIPK